MSRRRSLRAVSAPAIHAHQTRPSVSLRFVPNIEDRNRALEHIAYERDMMIDCFKLKTAVPALSVPERNALEESCLIHARALRFFLVKEPDRTKSHQEFDIWSGDYFTDPNARRTWTKRFEPMPALLRELDTVAGRFVAHPSYKRLHDEKPSDDWISRVVSEIVQHLDAFAGCADRSHDWARFASKAQYEW